MEDMEWDQLAAMKLPGLMKGSHTTAQQQPSWTANAAAIRSALPTLTELAEMRQKERMDFLMKRMQDRHDLDQVIERRMEETWKRESDLWLRELVGNRHLGGLTVVPPVQRVAMRQEPQDDGVVQAHCRVVMNNSGPPGMARDMASLPSNSNAHTVAWQYLQCILDSQAYRPMDQAKVAYQHLCRQFRATVERRGGTLIEAISALVRDTLGSTDPWAIVFYCLRCGDPEAALTHWKQQPPTDVAPQTLEAVAHALSSGSMVETLALPSDNAFAVAVGSLLSKDTPWQDTPQLGMNTIEDYLMGSLSKVIGGVSSMEELGESILDCGPAYFGDPDSGGWSYALPLLLTQQYEACLRHLAETSSVGLMQAAHIGLVFVSSGMTRSHSNDGSVEELVASLLGSYSSNVSSILGHNVLVYLVRVPDKKRARQEIAKVIAETGNLSLVGDHNAEGIRIAGAPIDKHYSASEVTAVLDEAADFVLRKSMSRSNVELAMKCFMLAGSFEKVLGLLNRVLSPPETPNEDRSFWVQQTKAFHKQFLESRGQLREKLEQQKNMGVVHVNTGLLKLNDFFAMCRAYHYTEAWNIAEELKLVPSTREELLALQSSVDVLDEHMKQAYPAFLVASMEVLHAQHIALKREYHSSASAVARTRQQTIQERARLIMSLSSSLRMTTMQMDAISRLESLMI